MRQTSDDSNDLLPRSKWYQWALALLSYPLAAIIRLDFRGMVGRAKKNLPPSLRTVDRSIFGRLLMAPLASAWFLVLIAPVMAVFVMWHFDQCSVMSAVFSDSAKTKGTLVLLIGIPLTVVGLVIPFLALSINVVFSKLGIGEVGQVFQKQGINRLIALSLTVLGLDILVIVVSATDLKGLVPANYGLVLLVVAWWTLGLIVN